MAWSLLSYSICSGGCDGDSVRIGILQLAMGVSSEMYIIGNILRAFNTLHFLDMGVPPSLF